MTDEDKEEIDETGLFVFTMQCILSNKRISKSEQFIIYLILVPHITATTTYEGSYN